MTVPQQQPQLGWTRRDGAGTDLDISSGNEAAPDWTEMCASYLERVGAHPTRPHPTVEGAEETAAHLAATGVPILTLADGPEIPR